MRRIYDLLAQTQHFKPHFRVRLNSECQADIEWWSTFSQYWNGTSIMRPIQVRNPDVHLWSDASGSWSCGAFWQGLWFQVAWKSLPIATASIAPKEFFPILVASVIWGHYWRGCTVCSHCDNTAVVEVITGADPGFGNLGFVYPSRALNAAARGVWGHAPPGKFWDSGLQRSFLMQFGIVIVSKPRIPCSPEPIPALRDSTNYFRSGNLTNFCTRPSII